MFSIVKQVEPLFINFIEWNITKIFQQQRLSSPTDYEKHELLTSGQYYKITMSKLQRCTVLYVGAKGCYPLPNA